MPIYKIRLRVMRDGEYTADAKRVRLYRGYETANQLCETWDVSGDVWSRYAELDASTMLGWGDWLVAAVTMASPKQTKATFVSIAGDMDITIDITDGSGPASGDPAQVAVRMRVDALDAVREAVFVERLADGTWRLAGAFRGDSGSAEIDVLGGSVFALGVDDFGVAYAPGLVVGVGTRVRPSIFVGWLYEVTQAGTLPATEPEWWPIDGDNAPRQLGTARAVAVRYYRPLAHGPVPVEMI
ncbi:hypothetical protein [Pseudomonas linyingensis]|nr:hypothetical protein [Pseudomonas linyingensis]